MIEEEKSQIDNGPLHPPSTYLGNHPNEEVLKTHRQNEPVNNQDFSIIKLTEKGVEPLVEGSKFKKFLSFNEDELIILVTAYNETSKDFINTIDEGINNNIEDLNSTGCNKIKVIIIVDGLTPFYNSSKAHTEKVKTKTKTGCCSCFKKDEIESAEEEDAKTGCFSCCDEEKKKKCSKCEKEINDKVPCEHDKYFDQFMSWSKIKDSLKIIYGKSQKEFQHTQRNLNEREYNQIVKNIDQLRDLKIEKSFLFCQKIKTEKFSYQLMFCIKEQNKRKLNTHIWFLRGFCRNLKPNFIIFLDVGTKPLKKSLSPLYDCLNRNDNVAGCCGEIVPQDSSFFNFVVKAQIVEYKFSHILDKALESLFGYVSVLPGAFSAYRFECLSEEVLDKYFYSETKKDISMFEANMYLAEDRILCLELICMEDRENILRYVPGSQAETDVPDDLCKLMVQRRRWNNGSWFSTIYTILNCLKIKKSGHGKIRIFFLYILMIYYTIVALFSWILVGAFYVSFSISLKRNLNETNNDLNKLDKFSTPIIQFYVSTLIALVLISLSVKPDRVKPFLNVIAVIYGIYSIATIILSVIFVFRKGIDFNAESIKENISIILFAIIIISTFSIIVLRRAFKVVVKGSLQFFCLTGSYVNIFLIYSICNIHDFSWGNRPGGGNTDEHKQGVFELQRITWLCIWILSNGIFAYFFNWISGDEDESAKKFIIYFAWITFGIIIVKIVGGLLFISVMCYERCRSCFK